MVGIAETLHDAKSYHNAFAPLTDTSNNKLEAGLCFKVGVCNGACPNFDSQPVENNNRVNKNVNNKVYLNKTPVVTSGEDAEGRPSAAVSSSGEDAERKPADVHSNVINNNLPIINT